MAQNDILSNPRTMKPCELVHWYSVCIHHHMVSSQEMLLGSLRPPNQNGSSVLPLNLKGREPKLLANLTAVIPGYEGRLVFFFPFCSIHTHPPDVREVLLTSPVLTSFLKGPRLLRDMSMYTYRQPHHVNKHPPSPQVPLSL